MARTGRAADARRMMDEAVAGRASAETIYAAALFAGEQNRPADAVRLLERIPANVRTADMNRILGSMRVQAEVRSAASLANAGQRQQARQRLLAIASRPDPTGEAGPAAVRALREMGDERGAQEAARVYAVQARGQQPTQQLAAANALLEAGLDQEAANRATVIDRGRLNADQRRQASGIAAGLSIRASDQLNQRGDRAAAFDALAPTLQQDPQNIQANLALARLYQSNGNYAQAQRIAEAVLSRDPRDTNARTAAMDAAMSQRDWGRAEALLSEGRALLPNDARIPMLEARLARQWGDQPRARRALEQAALLRRQQVGIESGPSVLSGADSPPQAAQRAPAQPGYENPFRRVPLAGHDGAANYQMQQYQPVQSRRGQQPVQQYSPSEAPLGSSTQTADPLLNEINRQLVEVREEAAPRVTGSLGGRLRTGDDGLDALTEVTAGAEGSIAVPGIGGRLSARVTGVYLDSGDLSPALTSVRRFGGFPLTAPGIGGQLTSQQAASVNQLDTSQSGVALGAAYSRGIVSADIGTTPLGFLRTNVVGGVEIAPEISDGVRLRLIGERRAITDSLLSWAGQRDPAFGSTWGAVTRAGGRAQLEFAVGDFNFYLGGGYYHITGEGVQENNRLEAGAGFNFPLYRGASDELISGLDLVYMSYDDNLRFFTLGHGGYFSPQNFFAAAIPLDYRGRSGNFYYRLGASVGISSFNETRSPIFPNNRGFQSDLEARTAAEGAASVASVYDGQVSTQFYGGLRGDLEYTVTPQLRLGGAVRFDQAADWNETRGILYARYRFDR